MCPLLFATRHLSKKLVKSLCGVSKGLYYLGLGFRVSKPNAKASLFPDPAGETRGFPPPPRPPRPAPKRPSEVELAPEVVKRNRRLFQGALLGTLRKCITENEQLKASAVHQKREDKQAEVRAGRAADCFPPFLFLERVLNVDADCFLRLRFFGGRVLSVDPELSAEAHGHI